MAATRSRIAPGPAAPRWRLLRICGVLREQRRERGVRLVELGERPALVTAPQRVAANLADDPCAQRLELAARAREDEAARPFAEPLRLVAEVDARADPAGQAALGDRHERAALG